MARQIQGDGPFEGVLEGVAAGLVGTLAMTSALQVADRLLGSRRVAPARAAARSEDAEAATEASTPPPPPPTEQVAERLASRVFGMRLAPSTRRRLGVGVYWAYGAFWGALSAQLQLTLRPPAARYGVLLGLAVWLIGPMRLVPALGLYVRPASIGWTGRLVSIGMHVVYGLVTALTLEQLHGGRS